MEINERLAKARRKALMWADTSETEQPLHLTHDDLDALAENAVIELRECGDSDVARSRFTCYGCGGASCCPYVYDVYNTGGDCLADK